VDNDRWDRLHGPGGAGTRTEAERDRDRILYSSAFQRLVGITQVASPETGASFHNRLTHSIKVAQVGRRLAQALKVQNAALDGPSREIAELDEDSVEASCLGHDLGHPPFGHEAETELNALAKAWGGFEGNAQSFRILTKLALRDLGNPGLNLTRATLDGVLKYPWLRDETDKSRSRKWGAYQSEADVFEWVRASSSPNARCLEAEVMDWADDVTYAVHDLEDFYRVGLVPLDRFADESTELSRFLRSLFDDDDLITLRPKFVSAGLSRNDLLNAAGFLFGPDGFVVAEPYRGFLLDRITTRARSSALIDRYISAVTVRRRRASAKLPIYIDHRYRAEVAVLKELTWYYVIKRPSLETLHHGQRRIIRRLHRIYVNAARVGDLTIFPAAQRDQLAETPNDLRLVTDFIAGLTEEMAYELHHRLTGETKGSILDAAASSFA
jgi:dGTPase